MNRKSRQRGIAMVEAAIALIPLSIMLFAGVEISNVILLYTSVIEASRDGARMVVLQGSSAGLEQHVADLVQPRLTADYLTATVTYGQDNSNGQSVTVEVAYEYQPIFTGNLFVERILGVDFTIRNATTMPIP